MRRRRRDQDEDAAWIGYADFLMTLFALFLLLTVIFMAKSRSPDDELFVVRLLPTDAAAELENCTAKLSGREVREGDGQSIAQPLVYDADSGKFRSAAVVSLECDGNLELSKVGRVVSWSGTKSGLTVDSTGKTTIIRTLDGDATFETNQHSIRPLSLAEVREVGESLKKMIAGQRMRLVIEGHTDDVPYPVGGDMDNWMLSAMRAAAVARVFIRDVRIPPCQIEVAGFGETVPHEAVLAQDDATVMVSKRKQNRRVVFKGRMVADSAWRC